MNYRSHNSQHRSMVYKHLTEAYDRSIQEFTASELNVEHGPIFDFILSTDFDTPQHVSTLPFQYQNEVWKFTMEPAMVGMRRDHMKQWNAAFQIAMSHCLERGTRLVKDDLVKWIYTAAHWGHPHASWIAPLIEASCSQNSPAVTNRLRMSCLVAGACIGIKRSLIVLKARYPPLYQVTRLIIQSRHRPNFELGSSIPSCNIMILGQFILSPPLVVSECSLLDALKSKNVVRARVFLECDSADASILDEHGQSVLHLLSDLEDDETHGLALLCCH